MSINCFGVSRIVLIVLMFVVFIHVFLSRYILDEIYRKMGDNFFDLFPDLKDRPVDFNIRTLRGRTHSQLFKILLWNKNNIKSIIGNKQIYFLVISLVMFILFIVLVLLIMCILSR